MKTLLRPHTLSALLGCAVLSACFFGNSPEKLNQQITDGEAAKALTTIEEKLTANPDDPALNLLAVRARLALCQQRNCMSEAPGALPPLLTGLPKLTAHVSGPVTLAKDVSPLTVSGVFTEAMAHYQSRPQQPSAVLNLYNSAPPAVQAKLASGLFQPALVLARRGEFPASAVILSGVSKAENLPTTYTYAAKMLGGMITHDTDNRDPNLIALRSVTNPPLPASAAALLPWALLAEAQGTDAISPTTPADVLATLPTRLTNLKLPNLLDAPTMGAIAQELITTSTDTSAQTQWQEGWSGTPQGLGLALQRTALALDPNQPELWATYLPALVAAVSSQPSSSLPGLSDNGSGLALPTANIASETAPRVAREILAAANKLTNYPGIATPLVTFVSHLPLGKQQQIDLEKLSQALLIKAAEQGDVTSTMILAQSLPGVAQNNRQSVVPLLVKYIRGNLAAGNFDAATHTAQLLTNTLKLDIEFAPLVLEEFNDDLKRRKIPEQLNATSPEILLQPAEAITLDLGPIFTFMQSYFEDQPKVITSQLTTLIAGATGTYGQSTAMYRLGPLFPESTLPAAKQNDWLAASLGQALLTDPSLTAVTLADTAAKLAVVHPDLNLSPLIETAVHRAATLEDQRSLWQASTPQVKQVLRAIRPEFTELMQGIDAMANSQLNTAAANFSSLTEASWLTEAQPFIEQFNDRLLALSGVYVPVSASPALKTAAVLLSPQGLQGGKLTTVSVTFISRVGTLTESEPVALRTNAAATHRFSMPTLYNFDSRSLSITANAVAQAPQGGTFGTTFGNIRTLKLADTADNPVLTVTLSDGTSTPFVRTLTDPTEPLRPDGTFLIQSRTGSVVSSTQNILPPGSMITLSTDGDLHSAPEGSDTTTAQVYSLSGTLRHPASPQPISFTGFFDPEQLTSTFTINYPLPQSAQPARAAVRCQALAGPIVCGAHNLNSARLAYAALVTGLQTRESLATATATRANLNSTASSRILAGAVPVIPVASPTSALTVSATGGLAAATKAATTGLTTTPVVSATLVTSATITPIILSKPSPSTLVSNLLPAPNLNDEEEEEESPAPKKHVAPEPESAPFINHSGGNSSNITTPSSTIPASTSSSAPEPGAFINHSGGNPPSPTAPH